MFVGDVKGSLAEVFRLHRRELLASRVGALHEHKPIRPQTTQLDIQPTNPKPTSQILLWCPGPVNAIISGNQKKRAYFEIAAGFEALRQSNVQRKNGKNGIGISRHSDFNVFPIWLEGALGIWFLFLLLPMVPVGSDPSLFFIMCGSIYVFILGSFLLSFSHVYSFAWCPGPGSFGCFLFIAILFHSLCRFWSLVLIVGAATLSIPFPFYCSWAS